MSERAVSGWARFLVGAQVGVGATLAIVAAVLAIEVSEWWFVRVDLTASGRNTLDPETEELLEKLPEPVKVDIFTRPMVTPYEEVRAEAQNRFIDLCVTARNAHRDVLDVDVFDTRDLDRVQARQRELGVEGANIAVLSSGDRTAVLELFGEIAVVDWGNPIREGFDYLISLGLGGQVDYTRWDARPQAYRGPVLSQFNGAEAFALALKKVSVGESPRLLFAIGHGELNSDENADESISRLVKALEQDGFEVGTWNGLEDGGVPPDAAALVLLGADQPYQDREHEAVRDYVDQGGRLVIAPSIEEVMLEREGGLVTMMADYHVLAQRGVLSQVIKNAVGQDVDGAPECSVLVIGNNGLSASHPLTEPIRRRGRRVTFTSACALDRGNPQGGWTTFPIVHSPKDSWLDLFDAEGRPDFRFDRDTETRTPRGLVMLSQGPSLVQAPGEALGNARVLALGSDIAFMDESFDANRDFLLSMFNWITERDYRVGVTPRNPELSFLDVDRGSSYSILAGSVWFGLPGLFAGIGIVAGMRRRKG